MMVGQRCRQPIALATCSGLRGQTPCVSPLATLVLTQASTEGAMPEQTTQASTQEPMREQAMQASTQDSSMLDPVTQEPSVFQMLARRRRSNFPRSRLVKAPQ